MCSTGCLGQDRGVTASHSKNRIQSLVDLRQFVLLFEVATDAGFNTESSTPVGRQSSHLFIDLIDGLLVGDIVNTCGIQLEQRCI